jgi:hypothetical protein
MLIDSQQLAPVIGELMEFVKAALACHEQDEQRIKELETKLAGSEKIVLEKVASTPPLDPVRMTNLLSDMVRMRLLAPGEDVKIAFKLKEDPNNVLPVMAKMAEALVAPHEGQEFYDAENLALADPDGWTDMAEGRRVKVKGK